MMFPWWNMAIYGALVAVGAYLAGYQRGGNAMRRAFRRMDEIIASPPAEAKPGDWMRRAAERRSKARLARVVAYTDAELAVANALNGTPLAKETP